MPQIDCYLCEADLFHIAEALFARGARIIPDLEYSTRDPLVISSSEKLGEVIRSSDLSLLFVVSSLWQRSPLQMGSVTKGGRKVFYVSQKEGGPTLDIFYPRPREINSMLAIPAGFISYHARFRNPMTGQMESAPSH